ncbi:hypothetical protein, partial [Streptomyces sp. SAS_270]|uniref:hypothetical protein n=1 Tax=Streptomyces sp. SAS_270 TaxID=3412748 RepID=UPI00403CC887
MAVLAAMAVAGCATTTAQRATAPALPGTERGRDDLIDAAQRLLVDRCLARQGFALRPSPGVSERSVSSDDRRSSPVGGRTSPVDRRSSSADRRLQGALFGRGRPELSVTLATGYTVTAHTDGCLAAAQRELYGDQRRWFRAQVVVNNLRAEARQRMGRDPDYRAATARWIRCATPAHGPRPSRPDPVVSARCAHESGLTRLRARLEPVAQAK